MESTPAQRFVCPRCRRAHEQPSNYCPTCGADMTHASPLESASRAALAQTSAGASEPAQSGADRRLSDSNQQWLGKVVDNRYRVLEVIGRGGMGVVYRVEHLRMGKLAAMKVLHRDLVQDADVVDRFEREAAAISKLHHPHTVQVFDFGNAQGALYLIMELVRGLDLAHIIERDGPLSWARAAPLFSQICGALQEAHELGIVHRDLKPENVLITRSTQGRDYAKVLDFGLAKLDARSGMPMRETERQSIVGTPYFMAPEQIRGDDVDARTDLYSLGALMFEVLTGQHLYTGTTAVGVLTKHLTATPDAPSMRAPKQGIPPEVDHLVRKALAREPDGRWQSAAELAAAIEEVYAETVTETTGARGREQSSRRPRGKLALAVDPLSESSDLRLRRSDIDAFESGIRWRRRIVIVTSLVLVLAAAGAAAFYLTRPPGVVTEEREPNDDVADADRIAAGAPVTGYLGKRRSKTEGDRDVYVVEWPGGEPRVVTIDVGPIPNLDLRVGVDEGAGRQGTIVDEGGVGAGETLRRRAVDRRIVVTIEQRVPDRQPFVVENVSDPYTLTITEEPRNAGEIEPNGTPADATPLVLTEIQRGYLDTRQDVDLLRWTGPAGKYTVEVRADGLPLQWSAGDGKARTPGATQLELQSGELIRVERTDRNATRTIEGRDKPWTVVVVR